MAQNILKKTLISQADNYAGNFGEVLRSSSIFWVKNDERLSTTISFSNYWKFKNFIDVRIFLNLRNIMGVLINRKIIDFDKTEICNYSPPDNFEGSVEIEVFSIDNMRIPYAAIMAVYESTNSISMIHSYTRAYSQHEIEDKRTISNGEESCWTIREDNNCTSFSIIHNGSKKQRSQIIRMAVRNWKGEEKFSNFKIPELLPYQMMIIEPKNNIVNLKEFLEGKPGNSRISFQLNGAFSRMLCGIKSIDNTQLQVTHSNFNYSEHVTDTLKTGTLLAYMRTPNFSGEFRQEVVVYPDTYKGTYISEYDGKTNKFSTGQIQKISFLDNKGKYIKFSREDNELPTRIVTGLRLKSKQNTIPAECSLGVVHHNRPKKNFHWMLVSRKFNSQVCWVDFLEIYGGCPDSAEFVFKLYTSHKSQKYERTLLKSDLPLNNTVRLSKIFDQKITTDDFCYLTIWCSYGGLMFFSTLEKNGSISIEHSF